MDDLTVQKAKARARTYRTVYTCLIIPASIITLMPAIWATFVLHGSYWLFLVSIFAYAVSRRVITACTYYKYVHGCLMEEMDPPLYRALLSEVRFASYTGTDHMYAAYYHGEHQTVIDLCARKMADPKCAKFLPMYLLTLAPTYFVLNDVDALRQTLDRYDAYLATRKNAQTQRALHRDMQYYRSYVEGDYAACRAVAQPFTTESNRPVVRAEYSLLYAIACYRLGDEEEARASFEFAMQTAPKMPCATVAATYLDAMARGEVYEPPVTILEPDPTYQPLAYPQRDRRRKLLRLTLYIILAIDLLLLFAVTILRSLGG